VESMDVHDSRSEIASKEVGCIDGVADKMAMVVACVCVCACVGENRIENPIELYSCIPHIMTVYINFELIIIYILSCHTITLIKNASVSTLAAAILIMTNETRYSQG